MSRTIARFGLAAALALSATALSACSDDGDDDTDGNAFVDEDFPGDSLDATCARLEAATGDDMEARAATVLDELISLGDEEAAVNTIRMATIDRCADWSDAVTAAIEARG